VTKTKEVKEPKIVPALYLGERSNAFDSIFQVFRISESDVVSFNGIRGVFFGQCYGYDIANGTMKVRPDTIESNMIPTEQEELEFHSQKEIVKFIRLKKQKAMQLKKPHKDIDLAVNLLLPFTRSMDSITLSRFVEYLKYRLLKRKTKR
jgi:hypothetical protein